MLQAAHTPDATERARRHGRVRLARHDDALLVVRVRPDLVRAVLSDHLPAGLLKRTSHLAVLLGHVGTVGAVPDAEPEAEVTD